MTYVPETHHEYALRVGLPRAVACDIDLGPDASFSYDLGTGESFMSRPHPIWICRTHDYGFNERPDALDIWPNSEGYHKRHRMTDRCPMSRLEDWRARQWDHSSIYAWAEGVT